jgi:signal transduction histidine kinase
MLVAASGRADTDSLRQALNGQMADSTRLAVLSDLCFMYVHSQPDSAMYYWRLEDEVAQKLAVPKYTANALNDLAIVQYYKGQYSEALNNNKRALEIRRQLGDKNLLMSSLNKIGLIYQELGNYEQATAYHLQVLQLATELNIPANVSLTLNNLSYVCQHMRQYAQARQYSHRQLAMAQADADTFQMGVACSALQGIADAESRQDSSRYYGEAAYRYFKQVDATLEMAAASNDLGLFYRRIHRNDSAILWYKRAWQVATEAGAEGDAVFYAANIGSAFVDQLQLDSAKHYLTMVQRHVGQDTKPSVLKTLYGALETYYVLQNQHDSAIRYMELYTDVLDTIYASQITAQANELLARYNADKMEQQITMLDKQTQIQQLQIRNRNMIIVAILILAALAGGILWLVWQRRQMRADNQRRTEQHAQQQKAARDIIAAEELERQRIARELHDGIGQMFSAVKLNLSGIAHRAQDKGWPDEQLLDKTLQIVDESCREVRTISHQMMPNVLLKLGLAAAVRDFVNKIDDERLKISLETFGLNTSLGAETEHIIYRIIQECVNNVIKHAGATALYIQLHKDDESVTVTVEDNGCGFDVAAAGDGVGLRSVRARVAYLNGKVDYDTAPGRGTLVAVYIPLKQHETTT